MGSVDVQLASELRSALALQRAVETGTYRGRTARSLAAVFPAVTTIELSAEIHREASEALSDVPNVDARQGHSVEVLRTLTDTKVPTLYFLDGHFSGFATAGADDECPVLKELAVIAAGNVDDCIIVDDAIHFAASPPPPHKAEDWPTLIEVFDAIRGAYPTHHVTVIADQVIAVPERAKGIVDEYAHRFQREGASLLDRAKGAAFVAREKLVGR